MKIVWDEKALALVLQTAADIEEDFWDTRMQPATLVNRVMAK